MICSSLQGSTSPATNGSSAAICSDETGETGDGKVTSSSLARSGAGSEASHPLYPSISPSNTYAQPIKRLTINNITADTISDPSTPSSLPFQFIDQQQLRQSSGSELRRAVRSHAKRDVDVKRKQVQAALKSRSLRPLLEKGDPKRQTVSHRSRKQGAEATISASKVDHRRLQEVLARRLIASTVERPESSLIQEPSTVATSQTCSQLSNTNHDSMSAPNRGFRTKYEGYAEDEGLWGHKIDYSDTSKGGQTSHGLDVVHDAGHYSSPNSVCHGQPPHYNTQNHGNMFNTLVRGSWKSDPFNVHGDLNNPRVSFLLSHYNKILDTVWVSSHNLLSFQTSRPGLLHATMLFTASHLRVLTGSKEYDRDILHHQGETIRIVNSSLDDPFEQTSDQMIAALSSLILYEESYGSKHIASIHRQGLQQILKLRYAKPDLGIHRFVQHILAQYCPPPVAQNLHQIQQETTITENADEEYCPSQTPTRNTPLGHALTTFFQWLTNAAAQYETASYKNTNTNQVQQDIEEYLEQCPHYPKEKLSFGFRSWLLAAMVYLHVAIIPPSGLSSLPGNEEEILAQLKGAMHNTNTTKLSESSPRLWVLMLNGLYSRSSDPVLLGSPGNMDFNTVSTLHWCRAQLLLRDIPWAERRWKLEAVGDDWGWVQGDGFWGDGMRRWSGRMSETADS